jgi:RNA-directed DNA polymerase
MSLHYAKKPTGGVHMQRVTESPDPNDHLLEQILSRENMRKAWKRVKSNKGAPGIDGISILEFPEITRNNWGSIRQSLLDGIYQPLPVKRVEIPKPTGGKRPLGIPIVLDRLIQRTRIDRVSETNHDLIR